MLKIVSTLPNFGNYTNTNSKCAEIHYQSSIFSILCIMCGMETLSYADFCEHFNKHTIEYNNKLPESEEITITNVSINESCFRGKHDPLKFEVDNQTEDSALALNLLKDDNEETVRNHIYHKKYIAGTDLMQRKPLYDVDDKEILEDHIKLENTELNLNPASENFDVARQMSLDTENTTESEAEPLTDNSQEVGSEDIDWQKSYAPNLLKNSIKRPYKARNTPNICTYCGKTFRRRLQLDTHLNLHTGSKPHQCEICGRQFRAVTTLARHRSTHEQREVFKCKFCAKTFSRRAALLSHELRHTQERRIPCDECEKLFYTINQMDTHKRKVHNKSDDASLPYQCNLCVKRYRSASMLSTHKYKKHYKTAKVSCEQCGKKFIDEDQLDSHKTMMHAILRITNKPSIIS